MNESACKKQEAVLDFEDLKARCLGNMTLVERVLAKFAGQLDQDLDAMDQAIDEGDAARAAHFAHRIKGAAASVAARTLFDDASIAEEAALTDGLEKLPEHVSRLRGDRKMLADSLSRTEHRVN